MDFLMLITAYGKLGDFNRAERVLKYMNKKGYHPSVISHTALMEAYGRSGQYNKAEAIFRRMQSSGPTPSPLTYQIILKTFVQVSLSLITCFLLLFHVNLILPSDSLISMTHQISIPSIQLLSNAQQLLAEEPI